MRYLLRKVMMNKSTVQIFIILLDAVNSLFTIDTFFPMILISHPQHHTRIRRALGFVMRFLSVYGGDRDGAHNQGN